MLPLLISLSTANDAEVRQYSAYALVKIAQNAEVRKVVTEEVHSFLYSFTYITHSLSFVLIIVYIGRFGACIVLGEDGCTCYL
jgi:hypothetical protein